MKIILFSLFFALSTVSYGQSKHPAIYSPNANAKEDIENAIKQAEIENKHVLIQVGGNWCSWCIKMHKFIDANAELDSIISADYVFVKVNYSKENKNLDVMQQLDFPQRFGFPVIVVLNNKGSRIHTQDTVALEERKSYSSKKIKQFLLSWNTNALNPENYMQ